MDIIALIKRNYRENYQLCKPLPENKYEKASSFLPAELYNVLKISNGIDETMVISDTGKKIIIGRIIYSFDEIIKETSWYLSENDSEGIVFAGNGAGGCFILKPNGKVFINEFFDEGEEYYADSLSDFFGKAF